jgi:hypothetical protein
MRAPGLGDEVLDALWSALAGRAETVIDVPELVNTLWGVVAADPDVSDWYPDGSELAEVQDAFAQRATLILSEYASLRLLIMDPDNKRAELTPWANGQRRNASPHPPARPERR